MKMPRSFMKGIVHGKRFLKQPGAKSGLAVGAASLGVGMFPGLAEGAKDTFNAGRSFGDGMTVVDEMLQAEEMVEGYSRAAMKRRERLEGLKRENMRRIVQFAPGLANQLLAGMELAQGDVVVGGRPRIDILGKVAEQMAQGGFEGGGPGGVEGFLG